jgi:hypothetical protein
MQNPKHANEWRESGQGGLPETSATMLRFPHEIPNILPGPAEASERHTHLFMKHIRVTSVILFPDEIWSSGQGGLGETAGVCGELFPVVSAFRAKRQSVNLPTG